jgi:hypothetical protein
MLDDEHTGRRNLGVATIEVTCARVKPGLALRVLMGEFRSRRNAVMLAAETVWGSGVRDGPKGDKHHRRD